MPVQANAPVAHDPRRGSPASLEGKRGAAGKSTAHPTPNTELVKNSARGSRSHPHPTGTGYMEETLANGEPHGASATPTASKGPPCLVNLTSSSFHREILGTETEKPGSGFYHLLGVGVGRREKRML